MKHDIESYIITIKRKGTQSTVHQTVIPAVPLMGPLTHEPSSIHEPQAAYGHGNDSGHILAGHSESTHEPERTVTEVTAPLPGIIVALKVKVGDTVEEGQELAVLEAMKMENSIESPCSGTVLSVAVSPGDTVSEGTVLLNIE